MASITDLKTRDGRLVEHWYVAALGRELKAERPIQRIVYDFPLALFRDENGHPVAVLDRCLHRGAQLSEGRIERNERGHHCLVCPYHGWTYNGDG